MIYLHLLLISDINRLINIYYGTLSRAVGFFDIQSVNIFFSTSAYEMKIFVLVADLVCSCSGLLLPFLSINNHEKNVDASPTGILLQLIWIPKSFSPWRIFKWLILKINPYANILSILLFCYCKYYVNSPRGNST